MAVAVRKPIVVDFSDPSGGCNSIEHEIRFFKNQVDDKTIGFTLKKSGLIKQPGSTGLTPSTTFTDYLRGVFSHRTFDGTERLYGVSAGVLSQVSASDGSLTSKYTMGGASNEVWACDSFGKKYICNGNSTVKLVDNTAYQIGLSAPSGASVEATSGLSYLDDGTYSVYVSYSIKESGTNVLYSVGESLGDVVLGGGNNVILVTFPNSPDSQVNNKVVWIKSTTSGELVHYFYHETGDNTTTSISIISATLKETSIIYEYAAADNGLPPDITFIFSFAGRLWGIIDNVFYYSNDSSFSQYNLEKWAAANYRETPYKLTGIFSVGLNLYFNTESGILILPYGDVNQQAYLIETRWYFYDMRTVSSWNNGVVGLTNQGVRIFDGERFTSFDLAYPIRSKIDKIYNGDSNFKPCGFVLRRDFRDEYHLMWQDKAISVRINNVHAVLNLSSIIWQDFNAYNLSWEFHQFSGNYAAVFNDNNVYIGQSHGYYSKIYRIDDTTSQGVYLYDSKGVLLTENTDKQSYMKTRTHAEDVSGRMLFTKIYCRSVNDKSFFVRVCDGNDVSKKSDWMEITQTRGTPLTFPVVFPATFQSNSGDVTRKKMPSHFWCKSVYVEVKQTDNDTDFKLLQLALYGEVERNNYL